MREQFKKSLLDIFKQTVLDNTWIPEDHRKPRPNGKGLSSKQAEFLMEPSKEVLYGGAAGGAVGGAATVSIVADPHAVTTIIPIEIKPKARTLSCRIFIVYTLRITHSSEKTRWFRAQV